MSKHPILTLTADHALLPVAVSFVESTCKSFRFGQKETTALMFAAEEIFTYMSQFNNGVVITLSCQSKAYQMELAFKFNAQTFNLGAFNLTSSVDVTDESSLDVMGLIIASKLVNRFFMEQSGNSIQIIFIKYRDYGKTAQCTYTPGQLTQPVVTRADAMETLVVTQMIHESESHLPFELTLPPMACDMQAEGDLKALVLKDKQGTIAGGLFWKRLSNYTVEIMGPFVYGQDQPGSMGEALVEKCLETIGKESVTGVLCQYYGKMIPEHCFEVIGHFAGQKVYFRQMQEDTGTAVWLHPLLEKEIRQQYESLFLPRNIIAIAREQPPSNHYSVIATELNRSVNRVVMHPLVMGQDALKNLENHLKLFQSEGYTDMDFQLDLGQSDQGGWVPALIKTGFVPALLLPYGGKGDILIMTCSIRNKADN